MSVRPPGGLQPAKHSLTSATNHARQHKPRDANDVTLSVDGLRCFALLRDTDRADHTLPGSSGAGEEAMVVEVAIEVSRQLSRFGAEGGTSAAQENDHGYAAVLGVGE